MSIITDALRKAQPRHPANPVGAPPPSQKPPWRIPLIILGIVGLATLWGGSHHPVPKATQRPPTHPSSAPRTQGPWGGFRSPTPLRRATFLQPIMALVTAVPAPPQLAWKVDGVIFGQGRPMAIINGEVVEEGGEVHGAKVVQVNREQVELLHNGETVRLSMDSHTSKR